MDTFAVFGSDGFTKVVGLQAADMLVVVRFEGVRMVPQPVVTIDDPDAEGEYRVLIAGGVLDSPGTYQLEINVVPNKVNLATDIQVIRNLADVIQGMYMGTQSIVLQVRDTQAAAIADVAVQVFDTAMSTIVQAGKTGQSDGNLTTTLDPGSYRVVLGKSLCSFANPYPITVANTPGTPQTFNLVGQRLTISPPVAPQLCRLYGYLMSLTGQVSGDYAIYVEGVGNGRQSYVQGVGAVDKEPQGVAADKKTMYPDRTTGIWEVDLVRGSLARIRIDCQKLDVTFRVPDQAIVNLRDIVPLSAGYNAGQAVSR